MSPPKLTVVVPAYNEEARLGPSLQRIIDYLSAQPYSWTLVVVSDGSKDGTGRLVQEMAQKEPRLSLCEYHPNRGKGYAVRKGMLESAAEWTLFSDADLAAPIEEIEKLIPALDSGHPIAIGSRPLKESNLEIRQPFYREMLGRSFNKAVQLMAVRGIQDTQCGFKVFTREAALAVFSRCKIDGFGFDFESLMIARDLGLRIAEIPIRWRHQDGSKVNVVRDGIRMLKDLVRLRLMGKRKRLEPRAD